jgi:hypothetical protein
VADTTGLMAATNQQRRKKSAEIFEEKSTGFFPRQQPGAKRRF